MKGDELVATKSPAAAIVALLMILYAIFVGLFLARDKISAKSPDSSFASANFAPEDLVFDFSNIAAQRGKRVAPVDLAKALISDRGQMAVGKRLYEEHCASCHGQVGGGDGPAGEGLKPAPRDFRSQGGWKRGDSVASIFRTLTTGIEGSSMSAYDFLSQADRFALAHHVQSLGAFPHKADTPAEIAALDRDFNLSAGRQAAGKIPVVDAMQKMAAEKQAVKGGGE